MSDHTRKAAEDLIDLIERHVDGVRWRDIPRCEQVLAVAHDVLDRERAETADDADHLIKAVVKALCHRGGGDVAFTLRELNGLAPFTASLDALTQDGEVVGYRLTLGKDSVSGAELPDLRFKEHEPPRPWPERGISPEEGS